VIERFEHPGHLEHPREIRVAIIGCLVTLHLLRTDTQLIRECLLGEARRDPRLDQTGRQCLERFEIKPEFTAVVQRIERLNILEQILEL
jgi:hypothetical protein